MLKRWNVLFTEECQVTNADKMTELEKNCHFETTSKVIN